jgi:hypothetical protein
VCTYYYVISKKYLIQDLPKISMGLPHEKNILVGFFIKSVLSENAQIVFKQILAFIKLQSNLFCFSYENLPILHILTQVLPVIHIVESPASLPP